MNFVDYKCLENLIIEGEELNIANEGLGSALSTIANKIIGFFKFIGKLVDKLILFIKSKFNKNHKINEDDLKRTGVKQFKQEAFKSDEFKYNKFKSEKDFSTDKKNETPKPSKIDDGYQFSQKEKELLEKTKNIKPINDIKHGKKPCTTLNKMLLQLDKVERSLFTSIMDNIYPDANKYSNVRKHYDTHVNKVIEEINNLEDIYNEINDNIDKYYINGSIDTRDTLLCSLQVTKVSIDRNISHFERIYNTTAHLSNTNIQETQQIMAPLMQGLTKITNIMNGMVKIFYTMEIL